MNTGMVGGCGQSRIVRVYLLDVELRIPDGLLWPKFGHEARTEVEWGEGC